MKNLLLCIFLAMGLVLSAQEKEAIKSTSNIEVTGQLKSTRTITIEELGKYTVHPVGDLVIYNHLGEKKGVQKQMKGVLVKEVLAGLEYDSPSPRQLSEFYLAVKASDGYTVVYSWNELFNSPTGDHVFFITEKEGLGIDKMKESILLVTTSDFKTGRRNVKAVEKIFVARVQ